MAAAIVLLAAGVVFASRYEQLTVGELGVYVIKAQDGATAPAITASTISATSVSATTVSATTMSPTKVISTQGTASLTNNSTLTVAYNNYSIAGIGQAAASTNVVTIAAPGTAMVGAVVVIGIGATSSNLISVADSGNVDLASAWLGGVGDVLSLYAVSSTKWLEFSRSNN